MKAFLFTVKDIKRVWFPLGLNAEKLSSVFPTAKKLM